MRALPLVLVLLASPALATDYVCRGPDPDHVRTLCPDSPLNLNCVIASWTAPMPDRGCTEPMEKTDPEWIEYRDRELKDDVLREQLMQDIHEHYRWRALIQTIAELTGKTPAEVRQIWKGHIDLQRARRRQ